MALMVSTASAVTVTDPAGWARVTSTTAVDLTTTVFQRVAAGTDAGTVVPIELSTSSKVTVQLVAYGGTRATSPVSAVTATDLTNASARTAPAANVETAGSWTVWYWAEKSSTDVTWTPPAGGTARGTQAGIGVGKVSSLIADPGLSRPVGVAPEAVATTSAATSKATTVTLVFAPA
jgi:hypothetical protein